VKTPAFRLLLRPASILCGSSCRIFCIALTSEISVAAELAFSPTHKKRGDVLRINVPVFVSKS